MSMDETQRAEIGRVLLEAIKKARGYADFFGWPDRAVMERGVVQSFEETRRKHGRESLREVRSRREDPPDCEARDAIGRRIGIELTELVQEDAIRDHKKGTPNRWAEWDRAKVLEALQRRIRQKDRPEKVKGGPYDWYMLIIHCDEPELAASRVEEMLAGYLFDPTVLIDRAYLLLSYDPQRGECPIVELSLGAALYRPSKDNDPP